MLTKILRCSKTVIIMVFASSTLFACSEASDLAGLAFNPPGRKPIDQSRIGVNNFFVDFEFGTPTQQFSDIRDTLGVQYVRVLFAWTDSVQPSPSSSREYSFYDSIVSAIPPGVDVVVVLAHTPSWITNPSSWVNGNPRTTFVEEWLKPTVRRYSGMGSIIGWEVWNEPDLTVVPSDAVLELTDPANYFELLNLSAPAIKSINATKLVVLGATQSIQQNFPVNLNYNKTLRNLGAEFLVDVWNVHYYGTRFESVVTDSGVADFLNGIGKPIWITESGEQGPNNQLAYAETAWPFLLEQVPGISRIYVYQYTSTAPLEQNYGLRTNNPSFPVSDLYINLRDN